MRHYFIDDGMKHELKYIEYRFKGEKFRFAAHAGVFSKDHVDPATGVLLNCTSAALESHAFAESLLDMGCGYGVIGIVLAKLHGLRLTQSDVNPAAIELTRKNCKANRVCSDIILSDCFENIAGTFDTIVINPPIHAGKAVTYAMYEQSRERLTPGGKLYIVTLKKHGALSTIAKLTAVFGNCEVIYKKKGVYVLECANSSNCS
jgi:16S rRNA (guanine1207-N2)-methyltransferase